VGIRMELRQLRYFIAVAERLSFSKAAQHLHVTVPPLSRQIRQLEEDLDVQLFVRDRRRVELTDAGRMLLREARALVDQTAHVCNSVRLAKAGSAGLVRVGIGLGLGERVGHVILEHTKEFPLVEVQCLDVFSTFQTEALLEGKIDIGFLRPFIDSDRLGSELLFEERLSVHISKASPLAKRKALRVKDLACETLLLPDRVASTGLYDKTLELYAKAGIVPKVHHISMDPAPHSDLQTVLIASRKGIFIMPDEAACNPSPEGEVVAIPLEDPDAKIGVYAAWRKSESSAAVLSFLRSTRKVFSLEQAHSEPRSAATALDPRLSLRGPKSAAGT